MRKIPEPYKHQIKAFNFIEFLDSFALFMEQGTGKSKTVLMKIASLFYEGEINSLIIICPNTIKEQWLKEQIKTHWPFSMTGLIWDGFGAKKKKKDFFSLINTDIKALKVFIINIEAFQSNKIDEYVKEFCAKTKPFIVIDESTRIKNPAAKRTKKILAGFAKRKYKAILTGTPTPKSPFDLYSQFEFLVPGFWGMSFFQFKHRYGIMLTETNKQVGKKYQRLLDEVVFNKIKNFLNRQEAVTEDVIEEASIRYQTSTKNIIYIKNMDKYYPYKNMDELNQKINSITFKVMKKDCMDLPDKVYETLFVELNPEQKRIYKQLQKEMTATYFDKEINVTNKMIMTMRLQMITGGIFPYADVHFKQIIDNNGENFHLMETKYKYQEIKNCGKIKALLLDLEEVDMTGTQIIVWANFVGEILMANKFLKENGYNVVGIWGGVKQKERAKIINAYQQKEFDILVINTSIGGEGLNLQCATLHYFYSNGFRPDLRLQAEDRSHRAGQTNKVTYKDLICKGTVDEKIIKCLAQGKHLIDYFRNSSLEEVIY